MSEKRHGPSQRGGGPGLHDNREQRKVEAALAHPADLTQHRPREGFKSLRKGSLIDFARVIALATTAREGRVPHIGRFGESAVVRLADFEGDPSDYDIVICDRNQTRRELNRYIRKRLGFTSPMPMVGEKLLVLRNRHRRGLVNGEIVTVADVGHEKRWFPPLAVVTDDARAVGITAPVDPLLNDDSNASGAQGDPVCWGYAITGHKAQGSQWNSVLLIDESVCFREHRWRWLYTAITRAISRITVVR